MNFNDILIQSKHSGADAEDTLLTIHSYITKTVHKENRKSDLRANELICLYELSKKHPFEALILAFEYGNAKGYRAGRRR